MSINFKQSQFELFPSAEGAPLNVNKPRFMVANLTLSFENLIVVSVFFLMLIVVSFSLGVERGKKVTAALDNRPTKERVRQNRALDKKVAVHPRPIHSPVAENKPLAAVNAPDGKVEANAGAKLPSVPARVVQPIMPSAQAAQPVGSKSVIVNSTALALTPAESLSSNQKPLQNLAARVYSGPDSSAVFSGKRPFTIQVASFKKEEFARKEAEILQKKGYDIFVVLRGSHFIVCVGKFLQEEGAQRTLVSLKKQYKDCLVRRL